MPYVPSGRPRGRPRKNPLPETATATKAARGAEPKPVGVAAEPRSDMVSEIGGISGGRARSLANLRPPFAPGQSGNPSGHPKGYVPFSLAYRQVAALSSADLELVLTGAFPSEWPHPRSVQYQVAARAYTKMLAESPPALLSEVADRSDGKVTQHITQTLDVKGIIALPAPPPGIAWAEVIEAHLATEERKLLPEGDGEGE